MCGPWTSVDDLELSTLGWVHSQNHERLHNYLDDVPPVEFETVYYDKTADQSLVGIK